MQKVLCAWSKEVNVLLSSMFKSVSQLQSLPVEQEAFCEHVR